MTSKLKQHSLVALAGAACLAASSLSKAALIVSASKVGTESVDGGTYDIIDFDLTGLTGVDATSVVSGADPGLINLSGTFTPTGTGAVMAVPGAASGTYAFTKYVIDSLYNTKPLTTAPPSQGGTGTNDASYVNLDSLASAVRAGGTSATATGSSTSLTGTATSLVISAFSNAAAGGTVVEPSTGPNPNPLIAQILVSTGGGVSFTGTYGSDGGTATPAINFAYTPGGGTTSSSSSSAQPIISLLTTAPTSYASQLGSTIALTYTGPGGYVPGSTTFSALSKGYGVVTGFHTPDTEIYALDVLNASGGALTSAQISAVVSDINASESGVTASLVTGVYSKLFPGYDVLLTGTTPATTGTSYYLGIDFSATGDQDPATQGFTVGAIAAVPEPATMAGLVLGASGLLLGRRKNRAVAA
jgi:hypothetical protein